MINVTPTLSTSEAVDLVNLSAEKTALEVKGLDLFYGNKQALFNVGMKIPKGQVTAFIGPSGCGKSTLLRCINRMNDLVEICRIEGEILLHGQNIMTNVSMSRHYAVASVWCSNARTRSRNPSMKTSFMACVCKGSMIAVNLMKR